MPRNAEPSKGPLIAPSILSADFSRLADEAAAVTGADWLHVDVMDNHFVPNLTLGLPVVESLLAATNIPMDCHLMIEDPDRWAPPYAEAGAYHVTFHAEATQTPIDLVAENTRGLPVEVLRVDGRHFDLAAGDLAPGFDRVLVDVPCTGLGALRRRPEARWRRQPADVPALARLQRELLASAIELTRPGGVVLYATCSPHLAETTGIVVDALRRHPVCAMDTRPLFEPVREGLGDGPQVQLWPHRQGTDAMFAAALRRLPGSTRK